MIIFSVYVNDIFSTASSATKNDRFTALLKSKWEISELSLAKFAVTL